VLVSPLYKVGFLGQLVSRMWTMAWSEAGSSRRALGSSVTEASPWCGPVAFWGRRVWTSRVPVEKGMGDGEVVDEFRSGSASRQRRTRPGSTTTKSCPSEPDTLTSPWLCSPPACLAVTRAAEHYREAEKRDPQPALVG
jgi:hypothetical protein